MMVWPPITSCGPRSSVPPATSRIVVVPLFSLSVTSVCVSSSSSTMSFTFGCCASTARGDTVETASMDMRASFVFILPPVANLISPHQAPELFFVEQRDAMAFLAQALDFHQLQPAVPAGGLQRIGPSADDDRGARRGTAVNDGPGAPRRALRFVAPAAQDACEREVDAFQRAQDAGLQAPRRSPERRDHLVGALVALAALADAAVDDLLQMVAAGQGADFEGPHARPRVTLDQHPQQLADLVDVVSGLP